MTVCNGGVELYHTVYTLLPHTPNLRPHPRSMTTPPIYDHTFHFPRDDLDAVLGQMEGELLVDPLLQDTNDPLLVLSGQETHACRAEDEEGGMLVMGGRDVVQGKVQQWPQVSKGGSWTSRERGNTCNKVDATSNDLLRQQTVYIPSHVTPQTWTK